MTKRDAGLVLAAVVALLVFGLTFGGCCKPGDSSGWCKTERAMSDCAAEDLPVAAVAIIEGALASAPSDERAKQDIASLVQTFGPVVLCIVDKVIGQQSAAMAKNGMRETPLLRRALLVRGR